MRRSYLLALGFCLFFLVNILPAQDRGSGSPEADVILITIDTLRADYLGCYGRAGIKTPALDGLAADGVLFEKAYSQVPLTPPSHASIMTGVYPPTHGLRDFAIGQLRPEIPTIAKILHERGYQTAAFVSAFVLDRSWGLNAGFDLYADDFDLKEFEGVNPGNVQRRAGQTLDRVLPWLKEARSPFFLWVHLFDPHHDYNPPEPFKTTYASDLYAGEVAYTDSQIGRLFTTLKSQERYKNSLIIATSDHGESLGEHGERRHGLFLYDATLHIPLIMKLPQRYKNRKVRISTVAQTVDILPTVLQVLRIPLDPKWDFEGRGLLSAILRKGDRPRFVYAETLYPQSTFGWSPLRLYREGRFKLIEAPKAELYDTSKDPAELENLYASNQSMAHYLEGKLRKLEANFGQEAPLENELDAERAEKLSALGYISLSKPVAGSAPADAVDPKDRVEIFNRVQDALQLADAAQYKRSNAMLEEIAKLHPDLFVAPYRIGMNYLKLRDPQRALESLDRAARLNPDYPSIDVSRASALSMMGQNDRAIEMLERVIRKKPTHLVARRRLALLLARKHDYDAAIRVYRAILSERPGDKQATEFLGIALVQKQAYPEGLEVINQALEMGVDDALLHNFQGIALNNLGRNEEAVQSFQKALEIRPDYAEVYLNLAFTLKEMGKNNEALQRYEELCRLNQGLCTQYRSRFQSR